jgi:D-cysteine desulfhydrase
MPSADAALDAVPRVPLALLPTALQEAPRLAAHLGLRRLLVKRDDTTGLAMGGNKARKLEYDLAPALARGCDVVVTVGGTQSNHAVLTAAAARRLGLDVKLVLGGPDVAGRRGNLLLGALYGAEVRYLVDDDENDSLAAAMDAWVAGLREEGRRPFAVPLGGSTGAGALGYARAMRELASQLGTGPVQLVTAVGSCGTFAGLCLGARLFLPAARVFGISVSREAARVVERTAELVAESARILGIEPPLSAGDLECHDAWRGEYGVATEAGREAILAAARLEGLLLDPVYTGKAMAGLFGLARGGLLDPAVPVVFVHTGGLPILFAFDDAFHDAAPFTRVPARSPGAGLRSPAGPPDAPRSRA